jgi:two-component system sensor histidine kinase DegS
MSNHLKNEEIREEYINFLREKKAEYTKALDENDTLINLQNSQIAKLNELNKQKITQLNYVKSQIDSLPRQDIVRTYEETIESLNQMIQKRTQLENLQNKKQFLEELLDLIEKTNRLLEEEMGGAGKERGTILLQKLIDAQEAERQRLSRQMHDGPAQALSNFVIQMEIVSRLFDVDPTRAKQELENLKAAALSTFQKVRLFITDLRPMMLDDLGLFPTLKRYVENFQNESGIDIKLEIMGAERRLEPYIEVLIFRSLQEVIGNAARHNNDLSHKLKIEVSIIMDSQLIKVQVKDNGKGFDSSKAMAGKGLGLKLIKERVEMLGGYFNIDSRVGGRGTVVSFQIPYSHEETT